MAVVGIMVNAAMTAPTTAGPTDPKVVPQIARDLGQQARDHELGRAH
jgi:hypothetical protein